MNGLPTLLVAVSFVPVAALAQTPAELERLRAQQEAIDRVEATFREAEAARQSGQCSRRDEILKDISFDWIPRASPFVQAATTQQWRVQLEAAYKADCPPAEEPPTGTTATVGAPGTQAAADQKGAAVKQQQPADDILEEIGKPPPPPSLLDQARTANRAHADAAERCDTEEMARQLKIIEKIEKDAAAGLQTIRAAERVGGRVNSPPVRKAASDYGEIGLIREAMINRPRNECPKRFPPRYRFTLPAPQPQQQQQPRQGALLDRTSEQLLALHNQVRAQVGSAPLQWDPQLAAQAAAYGPTLAQYDRPVHSPRAGRETSRENLLQAHKGTHVDKMVGVWIAERRNFVPGTFPDVSRTGNWADVAHYTQMIWPTTTRVGCAVQRGIGRFDWLICRYSPPGNKDGKPVIQDSSASDPSLLTSRKKHSLDFQDGPSCTVELAHEKGRKVVVDQDGIEIADEKTKECSSSPPPPRPR